MKQLKSMEVKKEIARLLETNPYGESDKELKHRRTEVVSLLLKHVTPRHEVSLGTLLTQIVSALSSIMKEDNLAWKTILAVEVFHTFIHTTASEKYAAEKATIGDCAISTLVDIFSLDVCPIQTMRTNSEILICLLMNCKQNKAQLLADDFKLAKMISAALISAGDWEWQTFLLEILFRVMPKNPSEKTRYVSSIFAASSNVSNNLSAQLGCIRSDQFANDSREFLIKLNSVQSTPYNRPVSLKCIQVTYRSGAESQDISINDGNMYVHFNEASIWFLATGSDKSEQTIIEVSYVNGITSWKLENDVVCDESTMLEIYIGRPIKALFDVVSKSLPCSIKFRFAGLLKEKLTDILQYHQIPRMKTSVTADLLHIPFTPQDDVNDVALGASPHPVADMPTYHESDAFKAEDVGSKVGFERSTARDIVAPNNARKDQSLQCDQKNQDEGLTLHDNIEHSAIANGANPKPNKKGHVKSGKRRHHYHKSPKGPAPWRDQVIVSHNGQSGTNMETPPIVALETKIARDIPEVSISAHECAAESVNVREKFERSAKSFTTVEGFSPHQSDFWELSPHDIIKPDVFFPKKTLCGKRKQTIHASDFGGLPMLFTDLGKAVDRFDSFCSSEAEEITFASFESKMHELTNEYATIEKHFRSNSTAHSVHEASTSMTDKWRKIVLCTAFYTSSDAANVACKKAIDSDMVDEQCLDLVFDSDE